jgi:spore maturation protein CgeB
MVGDPFAMCNLHETLPAAPVVNSERLQELPNCLEKYGFRIERERSLNRKVRCGSGKARCIQELRTGMAGSTVCVPLIQRRVEVEHRSFEIREHSGFDFEGKRQERAMKLVIFGLTISSSWGNGHATLWRGLCNSLAARGHEITFFERDVPYYANHRDLQSSPNYKVTLYPDWSSIRAAAEAAVGRADVAVVTSYCPDALPAADLICISAALKVFYDLDTAVTLDKLRREGSVSYVPSEGFSKFDLVLSYVGGRALTELKTRLAARQTAPLYGSVDPDVYKPVPASEHYASDLSYLGTYAGDRQSMLQELMLRPAERLPHRKFLIGGAQYPDDFPWNENIWFVRHVPPPEHPAFYCSSRLTLNVTRGAMAEVGHCPSGRLFEAAACGTPIVSDRWEGLDEFFEPGTELLIAESAQDVVENLTRDREELQQIGTAARNRVLKEHTAEHRSRELERLLEAA